MKDYTMIIYLSIFLPIFYLGPSMGENQFIVHAGMMLLFAVVYLGKIYRERFLQKIENRPEHLTCLVIGISAILAAVTILLLGNAEGASSKVMQGAGGICFLADGIKRAHCKVNRAAVEATYLGLANIGKQNFEFVPFFSYLYKGKAYKNTPSQKTDIQGFSIGGSYTVYVNRGNPGDFVISKDKLKPMDLSETAVGIMLLMRVCH